MDSSSLTFLMHGNVGKDAAGHFHLHFWPYNAWQHDTISIEARHKLLRHDFSVYFKHIAQPLKCIPRFSNNGLRLQSLHVSKEEQ